MDKFLVLYRAPISVVDEWMKKPEQERKPEETKMMDGWKKWMSVNANKITDKSHEIYKEWLAMTRPAPGPGGLRRPLWFDRPLRPVPAAYKL